MDTHKSIQIFHSIFLVNAKGEHPAPLTLISEEEIKQGLWRINPNLCHDLQIDEAYGQRYLQHYINNLRKSGKYELTIWPYHAMLGGIGHALVPSFEEAVFFHSIARYSQPDFQIKGDNPLTEHYSVLGPEVVEDPDGEQIQVKNDNLN